MNYNKQTIKKKRLALRSRKSRRINSVLLLGLQLVIMFVIAVGVCGAGLGYGALKGIIASTPDNYTISPKYAASTIYDDSGAAVQMLSQYDSNRVPISSEQMPDHLKKAFVAIEDERFYEHNGVDMKGILRALVKNIKSGTISEGASTITQQLIKNNVFDVGGETNPLAKVKRKIQEQYLALNTEKQYTKDEIITNYLNTINLGKGTLGVEAAAVYYFGKTAPELTLSECAVLAGITKNPAYLNPVDYPTENGERRLIILKKMLDLGFITSEEYQEAIADNTVYERIAEYRKNNQEESIYSYFTDAVILQIVNDLQTRKGYTQEQAYELVYRGGLNIYSTQNTALQQCADSTINDSKNYPVDTKYSLEYTVTVVNSNNESSTLSTSDLKKYFAKKNNNENYSTIYSSKKKMESAVKKYKKALQDNGYTITSEEFHYSLEPQISYSLIDNSTGQVKVLVGGRGTKQDDLSLNRATSVTRQPGSTFKILSTYAPALDTGGMTLATVFDDAPYKYDDGVSIHNFENTYNGLTTIRDAITESNNIVAVKTLTEITPQIGFSYLQKLGFTTLVQNRTTNGTLESDVNQSLALGGITDGVTNVELTAAYASIANKGEYNTPILYTKVTDTAGNVILENTQAPTRVMKESTSWLLTSAMQDVIKKGTGKEAKLSSKMAVAGKTGTSSNNYDYWFCGYTPYYTASIWTGYDYNTDFGSSCDYHKKIWAKIMNKIIKTTGQEIKTKFDSCADIQKATICAKSGKLVIDKICDQDPEKSMKRVEYFAKGTVPTESCDTHISLTLCKASNKIAIEHCPKDQLYTKIYRKRPSGSKGTTADTPYCVPFNPSTYTCTIHTEKWYEEQKKLEEQKKQLEEQQKQLEEQLKNGATDSTSSTNTDGLPVLTAP